MKFALLKVFYKEVRRTSVRSHWVLDPVLRENRRQPPLKTFSE